VRVDAPTAGAHAAIERALRRALEPARDAGDLAHHSAGDWIPEPARFGDATDRLPPLFHADSELALALLEAEPDLELSRVELLVLAMDTLAAALGLDEPARLAAAARRRDAHAVPRGPGDPYAPVHRAVARRLAAALLDPPAPVADALARFAAAATAAAAHVPARLLPALVHLQAARLLGPADDEALACYLWERARDGLAARARKRPPRA
jgi:thiopeptide-type bacteriocin biosynthesis protein